MINAVRTPRRGEGCHVITVESLTRRYASFTAVDNVSFTALPGRVTGFTGPARCRSREDQSSVPSDHPARQDRAPQDPRRDGDVIDWNYTQVALLDARQHRCPVGHCDRGGCNLLGSTIIGLDTVWDVSLAEPSPASVLPRPRSFG